LQIIEKIGESRSPFFPKHTCSLRKETMPFKGVDTNRLADAHGKPGKKEDIKNTSPYLADISS